jgi:hypothetical protein
MEDEEEELKNFEQNGVVSVWVFREPLDPANSETDVLKEFCGVDYYDIDFQEGAMFDEMLPLSSLLRDVSYSSSFLDEAIRAAESRGVKGGYGIVTQLDFAYDPSKVTKPVAKDPVFLGCFKWHE